MGKKQRRSLGLKGEAVLRLLKGKALSLVQSRNRVCHARVERLAGAVSAGRP